MSHVEGSGSQWRESPAAGGSKTLVYSTAISIENIRVASPCTASWDRMEGDERVRFCGSCQKSVYNLSALNRLEAEQLVAEKEGRLCVRYYQRADGKVLTSDCPVGLQAVRRKIALRLSMAIALSLSLWGLVMGRGWMPGATMGSIAETSNGWRQNQPRLVCNVLNKIDPPVMPVAGGISAPPPPPHTMGKMAVAPLVMGEPVSSSSVSPKTTPLTTKTPRVVKGKDTKKSKTKPAPLHQIKLG